MTQAQASSGQPAAATLGAFIAQSRFADVPATVTHEAKRAVLNFIGACLGGRRDQAVPQLIEVLRPFSGKPEAVVIGQPDRLDMLNAALVNAVAGNTLEFDDTHQPTVIHPTAPVLPPILALADHRPLSGEELLHAFALGVDVACRVGNSVTPGHYARGWHITASCGIFGAAAASTRLLALDAGQIAHALGIAASQASGIVENLPTGAKNIGIGNSARNGLLAAILAAKGYNAAPRAIEGPLGFAKAAGDTADLDELTGELGTRWELLRNTYKPYPCGVVLNSVIDATLELRNAHGLTAEDIERVTVRGNALLLARADRRNVANERDAKVSIQHSVAVVLLLGEAGISQYSEPVVSRSDVATLRGKVTAELDASAQPLSAEVIVKTWQGRELRGRSFKPRGSLENPMSDTDIEAKVRDLAAFGGAGCDIDRIIGMIWNIDTLPDVRHLSRLLAAPS
jgi:2-methylcitrate dehydratase PrpD